MLHIYNIIIYNIHINFKVLGPKLPNVGSLEH